MGLENFVDGIGHSKEVESKKDINGGSDINIEFSYEGDQELIDVTWPQVREYASSLDIDFNDDVKPIGGNTLATKSKEGKFVLAVVYPWHTEEYVAVKVEEIVTRYDVIEPYPVFFTEDWKEQLDEAINAALDNKDELVFCDRCGGVRIIRKTNSTGELIRGCSNYPDCRIKEDL